MRPTITEIIRALKGKRFDLTDEIKLQDQLAALFIANTWIFSKEEWLDKQNRPDFFFASSGVAVEVKIKGNTKNIYKQCERYAKFDQVKAVLLITGKSIGWPLTINNKPTSYFNLSKAWL